MGQVLFKLYEAKHHRFVKTVAAAVNSAQEIIDWVGRFYEMFPRELVDLQPAANNASGLEPLTFELSGRDMMLNVRDEAKYQLTPLGVMVMDAQRLLEA